MKGYTETFYTPMLSDGLFISGDYRDALGDISVTNDPGRAIKFVDIAAPATKYPGLRVVQVTVSYRDVPQ